MSQTKAQLIQPIGVVTASGVVVSGVMTASSFDGVVTGSATSVTQGKNLNLGAVNAVSFVGDFTGNATGIITSSAIKVGSLTASSFVGDFTGTATSMARGTGFTAGAVTASGFVANVTGNVTGDVVGNIDGDLTGNLTGDVTGNVTGNVTGVSTGNVTGNVTGNLVGVAGSVLQGTNIHVGVMTAVTLIGDGSNLTGIAATNYNTQTVTANSGTTAIDLSAGNMITFNQSSNTTVSFANTSEAMSVTLIRDKDDNTTARTITWPDSIKWNGGSAPTLITSSTSGRLQQFQFLTRDSGVTWYGWENMKYNPAFSFVGKQKVMVWGNNEDGALGLNQAHDKYYSSPVQLPGSWESISQPYQSGESARGRSLFGTKADGSLWSWGYNSSGNLGLNDRTYRSSPTQVGTNTIWTGARANGQNNSFAVTIGGEAWFLGGVDYKGGGGINVGGTWNVRKSSPTQIGTDTNWKQLSSGMFSPVAVKTDGTLWSWGYNVYGTLGQGNTTSYSSPTQMGTGTDWKQCSVDGHHAAGAVKTNGTLWTWGDAYQGNTGHNDLVKRSSPTQIPGTTWRSFSIAEGGAMATKTDGTLWMWGYGQYGQLGQNNITHRSSPIQVGTNTNWSTLHTIGRHSYCGAFKTDGTFWTWGSNEDGMLGHNQAMPGYSSPMQVPGISITDPSNECGGLWVGGKMMMVGIPQ